MRTHCAMLRPSFRRWAIWTSGLLLVAYAAPGVVAAKEAQWIWSPAYEKELAPEGVCYFRKVFNLGAPEQGRIQIACDDNYELYVNGRLVGSGQNWKVLDSYDISRYLVQGANTVAVKATNSSGSSAGLVARVTVKQQGHTHVDHSTDATWKTALKEFPQWQRPRFNDVQWLAARSFGNLNATLPWGNEVSVAGAGDRFKVTPEFHVEWVIDPKDTGPLICMAFDEFGQIVAARENGPLVIVRDADRDGLPETVSAYCDEIKNCQGLVSVSGKMYAVGEGPEGVGMYRLSDGDQDGTIDQVQCLLKFAGDMGEHGPHALTLGPDGLLYMMVGNFAHTQQKPEATSPYHDFYEGELVTPRLEDSSGHAVGIQAPGGTILRTDTTGSAVELFAGGFQNPYDLAFNQEGELFTCDSDMEWDLGMPWYRPTRLLHASAGSEFGWRSGWAKWPNYYIDSLAPVTELGRGSPAGMEVYNHFMYPQRYHNSLFVCDWSRGRILTIRMKQHGATYKASAEIFLEGQPLNVTDLAVGPDGWIYFCTGGRETEGGIYRVVWDGKVPESVLNRGKGLVAALEQPQFNSAWARQRVAMVKKQLGDNWEPQLKAVALDVKAPLARRVRALEVMQLFGPHPTAELLVATSRDRAPALRVKAAYLMGLHGDETTQARLTELLDDQDLAVERAACEAMVRSAQSLPADKLVRLLGSPDRYVAMAAGRALQQLPRDAWEAAVLESPEARIFVSGSTALLAQSPSKKAIAGVLDRASELLTGYLTDDEFLDVLRVIQLGLMAGQIPPDSVADLRAQLSEEYPASDDRMNRELVRLLVYLQEPTLAERLVEQINSDIPSIEKMQALVHARFLQAGWTVPLKLEILKAYEDARNIQGGHSFAGYIENVSRDFFATFDEDERRLILADGVKWPTSALSVLAKLPEHPSPETLAEIERLDRQVKKLDTEAAKKLRIGICAVLGSSGDARAAEYLRELFESEPDRRVHLAIGLAQQPQENWAYLVRSLPIIEGAAAQEVLTRLVEVDRVCEDPESIRQVILRGLMLRENGSRKTIDLLEKWTGVQQSAADEDWEPALAKWQAWFVDKYPDLPEPQLPRDAEQNHWAYQELLSFLTGPQANQAVAARGAAMFEKAQCVRCHRYGDRGDTVGPDLTNISRRFQKKEILESILFPSHVISDQYATQNVTTANGRTYVGMVSPRGDGSLIILQPNGEKVHVPENQIGEITRNKVSAMPDGLLNGLTIEEIADLFAYLSSPPRADVTRRPARAR
ncbi:MAG TPA: HEAT repeat domain-containing protein [Pirellulales bacterium]|jgi:putative membrane-bound dehydrogenase-like protein|nr:HEAT repeat domain-containing protein [Pirellulales bacterium]